MIIYSDFKTHEYGRSAIKCDHRDLFRNQKQCLTSFWSFYAINSLWFDIGCGQEAYGYKINRILNKQREKVVQRTFETTILNTAIKLSHALEYSCRLEIRHFYDGTGIDYDNLWRQFIKDNQLKSTSMNKISLECMRDIFNAKKVIYTDKEGCYASDYLWSSDYGGVLWGRAAQACIDLNDAISKYDFLSMSKYIDYIFDLEHNNGFILNKTGFWILEDQDENHIFYDDEDGDRVPYDGNWLDYRFNEISSTLDYATDPVVVPYVSGTIRKLILNSKHLLNLPE